VRAHHPNWAISALYGACVLNRLIETPGGRPIEFVSPYPLLSIVIAGLESRRADVLEAAKVEEKDQPPRNACRAAVTSSSLVFA
jgi:hypothetical protein